MGRLIVNGDIVLDGSAPRYQREKEAKQKLECIESILEENEIDGVNGLIDFIKDYYEVLTLVANKTLQLHAYKSFLKEKGLLEECEKYTKNILMI